MPWIEHPTWSHADWQRALEAGETRWGYRLWVAERLGVPEESLELPRHEPDGPWIDVEKITWQETGEEAIDPRARLRATIQIGPVPMHLEAIAVIEDPESGQISAPGSFREDDLEILQSMMDTAFTTINIDGRDYVLVATPFGR